MADYTFKSSETNILYSLCHAQARQIEFLANYMGQSHVAYDAIDKLNEAIRELSKESTQSHDPHP